MPTPKSPAVLAASVVGSASASHAADLARPGRSGSLSPPPALTASPPPFSLSFCLSLPPLPACVCIQVFAAVARVAAQVRAVCCCECDMTESRQESAFGHVHSQTLTHALNHSFTPLLQPRVPAGKRFLEMKRGSTRTSDSGDIHVHEHVPTCIYTHNCTYGDLKFWSRAPALDSPPVFT